MEHIFFSGTGEFFIIFLNVMKVGVRNQLFACGLLPVRGGEGGGDS